MKSRSKPKKLIKRYSTAILDGLMSKVFASSPLNHRLTKGELRELFVTNVLNHFLTKQFDIGTGIIINQKEEQSRQTDIVIYDNRILPPFIREQHIGVYPAEGVLGVIEVKSVLDKKGIMASEETARTLHEKVYNPSSSIYKDYGDMRPLSATIGFYGIGPRVLFDQEKGQLWLEKHIKYNFALCLIGRFSWVKLKDKPWSKSSNNQNFEETKRFIAIFLDNLRTISALRLQYLSQFAHRDWLSVYLRDQEIFGDN
jgi:hypothetical protein